jgi:hypothetical protein
MVTGLTQASNAPAVEGGGHGVGELLPGHVVEVGLEHQRRLPRPIGRAHLARCPMTTWVQLGSSSISPAPPPNPLATTTMAGIGPNEVARAASSAAPVGVVSSTPVSRP